MSQAIVIVPKATLYENIIMKNNYLCAQSVSDELLSGWLVKIQEYQGNFCKIVTEYGYSGWLIKSDIRKISQKEAHNWELGTQPALMLTQRLTDVLAAPKVQSRIISTLFMGSAVNPHGASKDGWHNIQLADGTCGYVPEIALSAPSKQVRYQPELRSAILDYALSYLGTQYRWGGKTHIGIDCSGLTFMSYFMCGILIYRDAAIKAGYPIHEIPFAQIKPADLLYFPGHVALYLGSGKYIHCTGNLKSFGCVINSLNPADCDYRADLAESLYAVGSIFNDKCIDL